MMRCIALILGCTLTSGLHLRMKGTFDEGSTFDDQIAGGTETVEYYDNYDMAEANLTSPFGWLKGSSSDAKKGDKKVFYHVHIPKTAGTSLIATLKKQDWLPKGSAFYSDETCYKGLRSMIPEASKNRSYLIAMVREPKAMVYSEFYEACIKGWTSTKGPKCSMGAKNIHEYIEYFYHFRDKIGYGGGKYSAYNLQTRSFTCNRADHDGNHHKEGPENLSEALVNMQKTEFVILQDRYKEGLCIMYEKLNNELPAHCHCENKEEWAKVQPVTSNTGKSKVRKDPLTAEDERKLATFISHDVELYKAAKARFLKEVVEIETKYNTTIMC